MAIQNARVRSVQVHAPSYPQLSEEVDGTPSEVISLGDINAFLMMGCCEVFCDTLQS